VTAELSRWKCRAMSIPSAAIYMIGYEHLLSLMTSHTTQPLSPAIFPQSTALNVSVPTSTSQPYLTPTPFIAGCIARTISATVISPMELFRTRLQALPGPGEERPTYKNTAESISNLVKQKGITSLWRGLGPTLWRDVPFSGELFAWHAGFSSPLFSGS
jgi:solute carrier family 25 protein 39/40